MCEDTHELENMNNLEEMSEDTSAGENINYLEEISDNTCAGEDNGDKDYLEEKSEDTSTGGNMNYSEEEFQVKDKKETESFLRADNLKLHLNVHKEDKPYKCDVTRSTVEVPIELQKLVKTCEPKVII